MGTLRRKNKRIAAPPPPAEQQSSRFRLPTLRDVPEFCARAAEARAAFRPMATPGAGEADTLFDVHVIVGEAPPQTLVRSREQIEGLLLQCWVDHDDLSAESWSRAEKDAQADMNLAAYYTAALGTILRDRKRMLEPAFDAFLSLELGAAPPAAPRRRRSGRKGAPDGGSDGGDEGLGAAAALPGAPRSAVQFLLASHAATELYLRRRSRTERRFPLGKGEALAWSFLVFGAGLDVRFSVRFEPTPQPETAETVADLEAAAAGAAAADAVPPSRVGAAALTPVEGLFTAEEAGTAVLVFDNTYSTFRGKTLSITADVVPTAAAAAASSAAAADLERLERAPRCALAAALLLGPEGSAVAVVPHQPPCDATEDARRNFVRNAIGFVTLVSAAPLARLMGPGGAGGAEAGGGGPAEGEGAAFGAPVSDDVLETMGCAWTAEEAQNADDSSKSAPRRFRKSLSPGKGRGPRGAPRRALHRRLSLPTAPERPSEAAGAAALRLQAAQSEAAAQRAEADAALLRIRLDREASERRRLEASLEESRRLLGAAAAQSRAKAASAELRAALEAAEELRERNAALSREKEALRAELRAGNVAQSSAQSSLAEAMAEGAALRLAAEAAEERAEGLRIALAGVRRERDGLAERLREAAAPAEVRRLEEEGFRLREEAEDQRGALLELQGTCKRLAKRVRGLERELKAQRAARRAEEPPDAAEEEEPETIGEDCTREQLRDMLLQERRHSARQRVERRLLAAQLDKLRRGPGEADGEAAAAAPPPAGGGREGLVRELRRTSAQLLGLRERQQRLEQMLDGNGADADLLRLKKEIEQVYAAKNGERLRLMDELGLPRKA